MKKTLHILLTILFLAGLTASAQIQRGKKPTTPKTEQTSRYSEKRASQTKPKSEQKKKHKSSSKTDQKSESKQGLPRQANSNVPILVKKTTYSNDPILRYPFRRVHTCPISDMLNPMDGGIILGWTAIDEAVAAGGVLETRDDYKHCLDINDRTYWDHDGDGIITSCYFLHHEGIPDTWKKVGMDFAMSYNDWLSWLRKNGFTIEIEKTPDTSGNSLSAKLIGHNPNNGLILDLNFNYMEKNGLNTHNTLYSIAATRRRILTSTTDFMGFFPIMGVIPGMTKISQLSGLGFSIAPPMDKINNLKLGTLGNITMMSDLYSGTIVESITIKGNQLPTEWAKNTESRIMTYNKWIRFFELNGFAIIQNDPLKNPSSNYIRLIAVNDELGIGINVLFSQPFELSARGNDPNAILNYSLHVY